MNDTEGWRPHPDHDGYEVSDQGRVRSYRDQQGHPRPTARVLSPGLVKGYAKVQVAGGRQVGVHVLVLETFVGPRPPDCVTRHLNGTPLDNRLSNLQWGTLEENYADRRRHGTDTTGSRNGRAKFTEVTAREARAAAESGEATAAIAARYGVSTTAVTSLRLRRTWRHLDA